MTKYIINGGRVLRGDVMISGSKNAVLPILSATIINRGITTLTNCPDISDVRVTMDILENLGCKVRLTKNEFGNTIQVDATNVTSSTINADKACKCRSSVTFLGALTARLREANVAYPGGCTIGERPIDIHENALSDMGINTFRGDNFIKTQLPFTCRGEACTRNIYLKFPSVGATENSLMAAAGLADTVNIYGAATEPEIICLGNYLKELGAHIEGLGTGHIKVKGQLLYNKENVAFNIIPDRIEAATYLILAAGAGEKMKIHSTVAEHCKETVNVLKHMGCVFKEHKYTCGEQKLSVIELKEGAYKKRLNSPGIVVADAYPAFPTDAQSLLLPLLSVAEGETYVVDKIFPKRFNAAYELVKAGADIRRTAFGIKICGKKSLKGCDLMSHDLRGGAAMVIAGVLANGQTCVFDDDFIKRGYDNLPGKLRALGASITECQNLS